MSTDAWIHSRLRDLFDPYLVDIRVGLRSVSKGSKTSEKEIDKHLDYFLYCLQPAVRKKIHIFSLNSDRDLDDTIFQAIVQSRSTVLSRSHGAVFFSLTQPSKRRTTMTTWI